MQKEERRLRRQNQLAHEALMVKQRAEQSIPIGTVVASNPAVDATQAPVDFQPTNSNQPQGSDVAPQDPQATLDLVTPKYRPHPTYQPSGQHPSPISVPRPAPSDTPSHLMPIHASSTHVQLNHPTGSATATTSAGEDNLPPKTTNSDQVDPQTTTKVNAGQRYPSYLPTNEKLIT